MDCKDFYRQIEGWEVSGTLNAENLHSLEEHAAGCSTCSRQFALLLPFLQKDAGSNPTLLQEEIPQYNSVIGKVMDRLPGKRQHTQRLIWLSAAAAAAAAALLLILGGVLFFLSRPDEIVVQFELKAAEAHSVYLVGDFSDWDPLKIPLEDKDRDGVWRVKIPLLRNRSYTYNFLIDQDIWIPDPEADLIVDDGFGGFNSMINL